VAGADQGPLRVDRTKGGPLPDFSAARSPKEGFPGNGSRTAAITVSAGGAAPVSVRFMAPVLSGLRGEFGWKERGRHKQGSGLPFEILLQTTEGQTAGRRPLPGGNAGAQLKHQAAQHLFALGRPRVLPEVGDFTQGCQVKSTEGLLLHVILE